MGRPARGYADALLAALKRATPGVDQLWYDVASSELRVVFADGHEVAWEQLSDGYHVFMGLVSDIARRALVLNDHLGASAVEQAEGIVLIDEVDLHLHPRWQLEVLAGLRRAFPKLQFVVSTHSALLLSGLENRQVRELVERQLRSEPIYVNGRDASAILRGVYRSGTRSPGGEEALLHAHRLVDGGQRAAALDAIQRLRERFGPEDADVAYLENLLGWGEE
jgi:predicted ATP-binding protein involved in virulence